MTVLTEMTKYMRGMDQDRAQQQRMGGIWGAAGGPGRPDEKVEEVDVAVIHEDFRSVAYKLLEEAKVIISKAKPDERVSRYKRLGFGGITRVKEHDRAQVEKMEREKILRTINDYKIRYPLCQFLDDGSLEALCVKYGLVYAPAEYFNQEIPEENLREIEGFELDKKDYVKPHWEFPFSMGGTRGTKIVFKEKETDNMGGVVAFPGNSSFEVVATKDMFDVPSGFEFHGSTLRAQVKDPIVLKRVPKGFLIITAWGPEAELPEVNINNQ